MMIYSFLMKILVRLHFYKNGFLRVDLDKINLDDADLYEDDPETITHVRILALCREFEKRKAFKKDVSKKLRHPTR